MWGSVLGPHTPTHFTTPFPFLSPHPSPSCQHTSPLTAYTFTHFSTPHTSFLTHPHIPTHFPTPPPTHLFPQLPSPPPTPQHTSPLTPCTLPHLPPSLDYVAKLPCDDVALIKLTGLWKSPIKFLTTTGNLKSHFGIGNVNFRCMKVWRSFHVAKLLATCFSMFKCDFIVKPTQSWKDKSILLQIQTSNDLFQLRYCINGYFYHYQLCCCHSI